MRILLTGATGFIGQHFVNLNKTKYLLIPVSVREGLPLPSFADIDAVVHFGGKAHEMQPIADEVYFTANAELTRRLGAAAKEAGVSHFVYASSVKVYGNELSGKIDEYAECYPDDAYGKSKLLGEKYLLELADDNFTVSIVRPTLVYGSHVKGNMQKLLKLAKKNIPLPFGNIKNKRSMVFIDNLIALIDTILEKRKGGIFIAADEMPISTTHLISLLRKYLEKKKT